jgi:hypothetical protein
MPPHSGVRTELNERTLLVSTAKLTTYLVCGRPQTSGVRVMCCIGGETESELELVFLIYRLDYSHDRTTHGASEHISCDSI